MVISGMELIQDITLQRVISASRHIEGVAIAPDTRIVVHLYAFTAQDPASGHAICRADLMLAASSFAIGTKSVQYALRREMPQ